jgi:hypothetical protein
MPETTTLDRICQLQDAIREALPADLKHLVNELDEATTRSGRTMRTSWCAPLRPTCRTALLRFAVRSSTSSQGMPTRRSAAASWSSD